MITEEAIKKVSIKYQTSELNITREYFQHLFLSLMYQKRQTERLLFKGGTALRFIFGSPRFSEDLDFTGRGLTIKDIEEIIQKVLLDIEGQGIGVDIEETKATSGGYFGIIAFKGYHPLVKVQLQVSFRKTGTAKGVSNLISSDILPSYTLMHLQEEELVREKIQALLTRSKPRDFFDLYFILRSRLVLPKRRNLKEELLNKLKFNKEDFKRELKLFLPRSHHAILSNFKDVLKKEIERSLPNAK